MLDFFYTIPDVSIEFIVVIGMIVTTVVVPYLVRRRYNFTLSDAAAKGAEESFKLLVSLNILLLAFCLVRLQGDHRSTEDVAARHAMVILGLDRSFSAFNADDQTKLHDALEAYAQSVVSDEWPGLAQGQRNKETDRLLGEFVRSARGVTAQTAPQQLVFKEMVKSVQQLADLHEVILSASRLGLPPIFWYAILAALTFFTLCAWIQTPLSKLLTYVGGATCGVSVLLALLISNSSLFLGQNAVKPTQIEKAISHMRTSMAMGGN